MNPETTPAPTTDPAPQPIAPVPMPPTNPTPKKLSKGILALIIAGGILVLAGLIGGTVFAIQAITKVAEAPTTASSTATNIAGTEVTLTGTSVDSTCYTFETPKDYILSPNALGCQTEIRLGAGLSTGASLTSITVKAQSGQNSLDYFFSTLENTAKQSGTTLTTSKEITIDGIASGYVSYADANGISQSVYFVPDTSGKYAYNGKPVTSYLISGPTAGGLLSVVVDSFQVK